MKNRKLVKTLKTYSFLGKSLSAVAGGVVGFVLGGPLLILPALCLGIIAASLLEKSLVGSFR